MKNIIFFGDSYASFVKNPSGLFQQSSTNTISYIDLVANKMQRNAVCLGYGGVSWWYSYVKLKEWIEKNPQQWKNTEAMVMCLTNSARPKLDVDKEVTRLFNNGKSSYLSVYNEQYERWCYSKFLDEVVSYDKKIIVLPCFGTELWISEQYRDNFSTCALALIDISNGEFAQAKTVKDAFQLTANDQRTNHLNDHNNRALAKDIVNQLQNYKQGLWMPDKKSYCIENRLGDLAWQQAEDLVNKHSLYTRHCVAHTV